MGFQPLTVQPVLEAWVEGVVFYRTIIPPVLSAQPATTAICNWVALRADLPAVPSNSSTISDSEDDTIAKDSLEVGVEEAAHENGTKGDQDDRMYIFICLF